MSTDGRCGKENQPKQTHLLHGRQRTQAAAGNRSGGIHAGQSLFRPAIATWNSSQQTDIPVLNQPGMKNCN